MKENQDVEALIEYDTSTAEPSASTRPSGNYA
jgi:hypothetical protein